MADSGNIKVVVRCRPMNSREKARGASYLIEVNGDHQLVLLPPPSDTKDTTQQNAKATVKKAMPFSFDRSYDENTEQKTLFEYVGRDLLQHAFNGFNTCVFAYGQTGSGKSHSMVGYAEAKGLIPLTCSQLFDDIDSKVQADPNLRISVEVSYIEIYNEKVRDLLNPKNKGNLKVREHPSLGPYVEDLSKLVVPNFSELMDLMDEGNKARTVASTNMNETSSRSHAVFTLILSQKRLDVETKLETEKVSRISLVDLAGSERANSTGATGARLKEGANINRSLTTLGKVIAALASASMQPAKSKKKEALENFVPYRDSTLTWLLKDSLGGNSKTAMIAAISPADYEETLSTLRYADQAKKIKNKAVVNEDPNAKLIRELKEELETLRNRVSGGGGLDAGEGTWDPDVPPEKQMVRYKTKTGEIKTVTKAELQDQLEQSEKIMSSLNESWEEKLEKTQEIQREREKALEELGISVDKGNVGVHTPKKLPHLVNLNEDPLMSECLIYQLKDGKTLVGNLETDKEAQIRLSGENILPEHCFFENLDGVVTLNSVIQDSMTMVNGKRVKVGEPRRLRSGYRVILGDFHVFRFNNPEEVRKAREKVKSTLALSTGEDDNETLEGNTDSPRPGSTRPDSPVSEEGEGMDWIHARREAALARLSGKDVDFDKLNENDLDKLFEDISRARIKKSGGNPNSNRPESRMSFFDDGASESAGSNVNRPFSLSAYTDDTSVDPWHGSEPGSIKTNGVSTNSSNISSMSAEAAKETQDLKLKVKEYEEKIMAINLAKQEEVVDYSDEQKRLIRLVLERWRKERNVTMAEKILSNAVLLKEANVLSKQLGKKAVYQFVIIDHTNSLESNPTSSIDVQTIAGLGASELDDDGDFDLNKEIKPFVAVRVLDHSRNSIHIWSVSKLEQRLNKMRNLYTFIDRPEYSRHFDWADPFYESANNEDEASTSKVTPFSFVGSAVVPLKPLARKISAKYQKVEIKSRDTNQVISTCNVEVKFISISASPMGAKQLNGKSKALNGSGTGTPSRNGALSPTGSDSRASSIQEIQSIDLDDDIPSGHKLGIQFCVDSVKGLHAKDFSSVHLQTRLSSFTGPSVTSDDVYLSTPIDINEKQDSGDELKLRKTISFVLNPEISEYIRDGNFIVELFARATSSYLEGLEKFDSEKETGGADKNEPEPSSSSRPSLSHSRTGSSSAISLAPSTSRVSEKEMVSSESHDILVSVSICELNAAGEYEPVQVKATSSLDPGCFFLRQGLQRKIVIKMSHDSGRQFVLKKISKLELGEVRLLDSKGRIHVSTIEDPLVLKTPVKQQSVDFEPNGFSELNLWSWWDSSVHDSIFLNRLTSTSQRVLLKLRIHLDFERGVSPAIFEMDISVSINPRDSKPINKFFSFVENVSNGSTSKILNKSNGVFNVRLIPPLTKKTKELWRLDTGKRYVRGEECIKGWKPRGISLVIDHRKNAEQIRKKTEVEAVKVMLKARPPLSLSNGNGNGHQGNGSDEWENEGERTFRDERVLQNKALELWLRAVRDSKVSVLAEKADEKRALEISSRTTDSMPFSDAPPSPKPLEPLEPVKLTAEVKLVPRSDGAARRGWLAMPIEAFTDSWVKRWFVLQRPYLHVFADKEEIDEVMVMNLASVRLEHDENIEQMLDRNNVFCLYTASNSYFLQSKTPQEMEGWMTSLDASHR